MTDSDCRKALAHEIDALRKDLRDLARTFFAIQGADFEIMQQLAREGAAIFTETDFVPEELPQDPQDWLTEQPFGRRATARALALGISLADMALLALDEGSVGTSIRLLCGATHCHGYVARSEDENFESGVRGRLAADKRRRETSKKKARVLDIARGLQPGTSNEAAADLVLARATGHRGLARRTVHDNHR